MIGGLDIFLAAQIAFGHLCEWLVLSILLSPFQFIGASATAVLNGRIQNLFGEFRLWVVFEGKGILVSWRSGLFAVFGFRSVGSLRHDRMLMCDEVESIYEHVLCTILAVIMLIRFK